MNSLQYVSFNFLAGFRQEPGKVSHILHFWLRFASFSAELPSFWKKGLTGGFWPVILSPMLFYILYIISAQPEETGIEELLRGRKQDERRASI